MRRRYAPALLLTLGWTTGLAAEDPGRVLVAEACKPLPAYEGLSEFDRRGFDAESWARVSAAAAQQTCTQVRYASSGAEVVGYVLAPAAEAGKRWPAILFARGGTGDFGRVDPYLLAEMTLWTDAGFVVAATDYRFVGAAGHRDPWGGEDLDDLLNLAPLVRERADVDGNNLFLLGISRGGLMTYLALKAQAPVRAAAVIAGPTDLGQLLLDRPEFLLGWEGFDGFARIWPDYEKRSREHLNARSAVRWAEAIHTPLLLLHSRTDRRVPVEHSLELARRLEQHGKEYELVIYGDDGHGLALNREDRNRRIVAWFRGHTRR